MTVNSSANSVILILFAFSDNLSAENSKLSAESWHRGHHLLGCMYVIRMESPENQFQSYSPKATLGFWFFTKGPLDDKRIFLFEMCWPPFLQILWGCTGQIYKYKSTLCFREEIVFHIMQIQRTFMSICMQWAKMFSTKDLEHIFLKSERCWKTFLKIFSAQGWVELAQLG